MAVDFAAAFMQRCEELAGEAAASGEAAVGTIVACGAVSIAEAVEQVHASLDVTAHAEVVAIRLACKRLGTMNLTGCTLYTNVEPCWMCSYAIREARVSEVVVAVPVPEVGGMTSRYPLLLNSSVEGWGEPPIVHWFNCRTEPSSTRE